MSWSPDQDVVVMVTGVNHILMMTREFDAILEVPIETDEFGEGMGQTDRQMGGRAIILTSNHLTMLHSSISIYHTCSLLCDAYIYTYRQECVMS